MPQDACTAVKTYHAAIKCCSALVKIAGNVTIERPGAARRSQNSMGVVAWNWSAHKNMGTLF